MKNIILLLSLVIMLASCCRTVRTAEDITPGNPRFEKLDWQYGASDIRIQTTKITRELMGRWFATTGWDPICGKPRIVITQVDNRTDQYICTDMIRDVIEGAAVDDGRFSIVVGDARDERELDRIMEKVLHDPKYCNSSRLQPNRALAPQFLGKIRITKAVTSDRFFDYEDYRMAVTLYDIETQEAKDRRGMCLAKE